MPQFIDLKQLNDSPLPIYIGYDPVEPVAWHACVSSIIEKSSIPVSFIPLNLSNIRGIFNRERDDKQSNSFSFSRFLVPYLSNFSGPAIYMDCDMLVTVDIAQLFEEIADQSDKAIYVVKHDYDVEYQKKYLGTKQYPYPRKNWSSFVLWNCAHEAHQSLQPNYIETASGLELHRFKWLADSEIGDLSHEWNWLVGHYNDPENAKNIHWTLGGPYFESYRDAEHASLWLEQYKKMTFCEDKRKDL